MKLVAQLNEKLEKHVAIDEVKIRANDLGEKFMELDQDIQTPVTPKILEDWAVHMLLNFNDWGLEQMIEHFNKKEDAQDFLAALIKNSEKTAKDLVKRMS